MHIKLKNRLWTTVAFLHCCNLIWGLANNNYSLYFLQFLLYFHSLAISLYYRIYRTIEQIDRDIVLLLKITQLWFITIYLCGNGSQHSNISKGKKGGGVHIKISLVCKTPVVKVDRNKNVTLNRYPYGSYE
jgi:hypothetical protein